MMKLNFGIPKSSQNSNKKTKKEGWNEPFGSLGICAPCKIFQVIPKLEREYIYMRGSGS